MCVGGPFMVASRMRSDTEDAIAKVVSASCHHISDDEGVEMSGVSGGCSFVSLSRFTEFVKVRDDQQRLEKMALTGGLPHPLSFYYYVTKFQEFWWRDRVQNAEIGITQDVTDSDYTGSEDDDDDDDDDDDNDEIGVTPDVTGSA